MHQEPCQFVPVQVVRGLTCNLCRSCGKTYQAHEVNIEIPLPTPTRKELELCGAAIQRFESIHMRYAPQPPGSEYVGLPYVPGG